MTSSRGQLGTPSPFCGSPGNLWSCGGLGAKPGKVQSRTSYLACLSPVNNGRPAHARAHPNALHVEKTTKFLPSGC